MTFRVYKYPIKSPEGAVIEMPHGARVLTVQMQHGKPCIWALVDTRIARPVLRQFRIYGTGHDIPGDGIPGSDIRYVGTFQMDDGYLVFHVFEDLDQGHAVLD